MRALGPLATVLALVAAGPAHAQLAAPPADAAPGDDGTPAEYGTHGFLDRVSRGTEEVERCADRSAATDDVLRGRSSEHYQRGLVLYEQGDYTGAVREFVSAYCDKPHPDFYYNVAISFERLLEYEKAVAYFERYILEADEQAKNRRRAQMRVEVLRNLPGRITVATVPAGAEVTLSSETGVTARTAANREPIPIPRGTYAMRVSLAGHEPIEQKVVVEIGQPYSFYFRLEPRKGTVRAVATPSDARLFLGDRLVGIGSYVETVPIGRYTLTVERDGRQTQRRELVVEAGRTAEASVVMPDQPRSGRRELIAGATVGVGVTSAVALSGLFGQAPGVAAGGTLVGLGVGFGAAYLGIPEAMPVGRSSYLIGTTLIGATEGLLAATALACGHGAGVADGATASLSTCDQEVVSGVTLSGGAAGLLFGALTAARFDLDAGDAALVNSGALWGITTGAIFFAGFDADERIREPLLLAGLNLGVVAGATLAARSSVSRGRMALIDLSGLAGIVAGVAVGQSLGSNSERLNHVALVGLASGLITGTVLTRDLDEPSVALGTIRPSVTTDGETTTFGLGGQL